LKDKIQIQQINEELARLKTPHNITRKVRSIDLTTKWKSTEVKMFIFYFAIPILHSKLPALYFYFLATYVFAVRLLYEPIDDPAVVDRAERMLEQYHVGIEDKFGESAYGYTAHAHLHLAEQVRQHGPLHGTSAFVFEGAIGNTEKFINGTRGYLNQIVKQLSLSRAFTSSLEENNFKSTELFNFAYRVHHNHGHSAMNGNQLVPHFDLRVLDSYHSEFRLFFGLDFNIQLPILTSARAILNTVMFHSLEYNRKQNSNSYTVNFYKSNCDCFGEIMFFFEFEAQIYCFINEFIIEPNARHILPESSGFFYTNTLDIFNRFYRIVTKQNLDKKNYIIVKAKNIKHKCIGMLSGEHYFITKLKYDYEHD
jgi:hypothetical protein